MRNVLQPMSAVQIRPSGGASGVEGTRHRRDPHAEAQEVGSSKASDEER